ncbi:MAG: transporter substrate-binding domain-containing protein [Ruminococcus sp.]|nr:transporter substrate-binding domain-containing protein [Ruminococcus sp.]
MKKILALLMAGAMTVAAFAGCSANNQSSAGTKNEGATTDSADANMSDYTLAQSKGSLTIGITYFEPMNYIGKDGKLTGFETDFATAVCKELGVNAEFQEIEWDSKEIELNAKTIDCIWNGLTITPDREANMSISIPYMQNKQVMVVKEENADKYKTAEGLKDAKVVAEAGSAGEEVAKTDEFFKDAKYTPADSQAKCLLEVKSGTSDVAIIDYVMSIGTLREGSDYANLTMVPDKDFSPELYGIAFRKGSDLTNKVNEVIMKLYTDGTLTEIAKKYNLEDQIPVINNAS